MKLISKKDQLEEYYHQFPLKEYFGFNIKPYLSVIQFEPEESILQEGERPLYLYYLLQGRAKLYLSHENGNISLVNFLSAPCFIGEMELLDEEKVSNGVTAISTCICFAIRMDECKEELLNDTSFLRHLCRFLSRKAAENTYHYSRNQSYSLRARLASFVLWASVGGMYREKHTEVAQYLGVTYRHLLYVLAEFVKEGILVRTKQGYRIERPEELRKIAETGTIVSTTGGKTKNE